MIFAPVEVLVSFCAFLATVFLFLDDGIIEAREQGQCRAAGYRRSRRGDSRGRWSLRSGGSTAEVGMREIILIAYTVHAMILQPVHVLICLVASEVLAFVWLVNDDGVFGRHDTGIFLMIRLSGLADCLGL